MTPSLRPALCAAALLALAGGNLVSPGLGKCLDMHAALNEDGRTRMTLKEMTETKDPINVQLYDCHDKHNQDWEVAGGMIRSNFGKCLTAADEEKNSNVQLEPCKDGNELQQWELTEHGYIRLAGTGQCVDVKAEVDEDGRRESWREIEAHKTVNVHLYDCHDPKNTTRVNQLWEWAPVTTDGEVMRLWSIRDLDLAGAASSTSGRAAPLAIVGSAALFAAGLLVGRRSHGEHRVVSGAADFGILAEEGSLSDQ